MAMMRLFLVRHPRPSVGPGLCYGATDVAVARKDVDIAVGCLAAKLPAGVPVYSSPLQRCMALADPLAAKLGAGTPLTDSRLQEMNFGNWEMRAWDNIDRVEVDDWAADLTDYRPGGGESVLAVAHRVVGFLDDLLQSEARAGILVCHAGTIRLLLAWRSGDELCEIARRAASTAHEIGYGQMHVLDCEQQATPALLAS